MLDLSGVKVASVNSLPAASSNTGRLLQYAGAVYFSDGANWQDLSNEQFMPMVGLSGFPDGNVTISAGTTTITRTMIYDTLTLETGAILKNANHLIFANKIIQQGTGKIDATGATGNSASDFNSGSGGAASIQAHLGQGLVGGAGGTGSAGFGAGVAGGAGSAGGSGGAGGGGTTSSGGAGAGGAGASSGAAGAPQTAAVGGRFLTLAPYFLRGASMIIGAGGGAGGGAGAGDGSSVRGRGGGGGGAGGGSILVVCNELDLSAGAGPICVSDGGQGGEGGASASSNIGGGGGGAGGGGGMVRLIAGKITGSLSPGLQANGGNGGNGSFGGGTGFGGRGGQGGEGGYLTLYNGQTGLWTQAAGGTGATTAAQASTPVSIGGTAGTAGITKTLNIP